VLVRYFGGHAEPARVFAVEERGRRLRVRCQDGTELGFVLSPKTARFVAAGDPHGPRLQLLD
jgi:hypothetical protein